MLNTLMEKLVGNTDLSVVAFLIPILSALVMGLILSKFAPDEGSSRGFKVTLALLPAVVCVVIMAVNGNIGAGVAVAGAFGLVRFRSAQGSAGEIGNLFLAMALGLLAGMGYVFYAVIFELIMIAVMSLYKAAGLGEDKGSELVRSLRITIPEDLNYTEVFDEITEHKLISAKTSDMGSVFKLDYTLTLCSADIEKKFIDDLRCRNGNLEIVMSALKHREPAEL